MPSQTTLKQTTAFLLDDPLANIDHQPPTLADYAPGWIEHVSLRGGQRFNKAVGDQNERSTEPLVSVITPVYNAQTSLEETIQSVLNQSYRNIEYIIVDGGSNDGTLDIIKRYQDKITLWCSEKDRGMYDAINKGISLATGRYIKILNADDILPRESVSTAVACFDEVEFPSLIKGDMHLIDETSTLLERLGEKDKNALEPQGFPILHPTWYLPKIVYQSLGLYHTRYKCAADTEYLCRLIQNDVPIVHLPHVLAEFRTGGMSMSITGQLESLEIYRHYFGRSRALRMVSVGMMKKARYRVLRTMIGEQRAEQLRLWLKTKIKRDN